MGILQKLAGRYANLPRGVFPERGMRQCICLVTHICEYKDFCINSDLGRVASVMDTYYSQTASIIMRNGGVVDRFCDDKIVSFYGIHDQKFPPADRIVETGIEIVTSFEQMLQLPKGEVMKLGVGICAGTVIYGEFGSRERATVTAFGSTVICSGRLGENSPGVNVCRRIAENVSNNILQKGFGRIMEHTGRT